MLPPIVHLPWLTREFWSWWSSQTPWRGRRTSLSPGRQRRKEKKIGETVLKTRLAGLWLWVFAYFGLDAKPPAFYDHGLLGELLEQILPLAGQLAKRAFGHEKYSPGEEEKKRWEEQQVFTERFHLNHKSLTSWWSWGSRSRWPWRGRSICIWQNAHSRFSGGETERERERLNEQDEQEGECPNLYEGAFKRLWTLRSCNKPVELWWIEMGWSRDDGRLKDEDFIKTRGQWTVARNDSVMKQKQTNEDLEQWIILGGNNDRNEWKEQSGKKFTENQHCRNDSLALWFV